MWNDLAAARHALSEKHPSELPEALADVEHALQIDPKLAEAHFNRALILERLGLRDQARKEWQRYLEIDPASAWSTEARAHLRALEGRTTPWNPAQLKTMPAAELVRRFPQESRASSELLLLGEWAAAETAADRAHAAETLSSVRAIGSAHAAAKDEHIVVGTVSASCGRNPAPRADAGHGDC